MKRWIAGLLALMLLLPAAALAVSYPVQRGAVNDDAGVLSEQTAADIGQLNTAAAAPISALRWPRAISWAARTRKPIATACLKPGSWIRKPSLSCW